MQAYQLFGMMMSSRNNYCWKRFPQWLRLELVSDHAGETGAVEIYRGAIHGLRLRNFSKKVAPPVFEFLCHHQGAETRHLELMNEIVPKQSRSSLLPLWVVSGYTLGFIPAFFGGQRAVYWTIFAVETFVEEHYQAQIFRLKEEGNLFPDLTQTLEECCADEVAHKLDAGNALLHDGAILCEELPLMISAAPLVRAWCAIIDRGSRAAVAVSKVL